MLLKDTEVYIDLEGTQSHTLTNLAIAYLSLYIKHDNFVFSQQCTEKLLETPGCKTENVRVSGVANTARHILLLSDSKHPLLGHNAGCLSGIKEVSTWTNTVEITFPMSLAAASNIPEVQSALIFLDNLFKKPFIGHNQRKIRHEAIKLGVLPEHGILSHIEWAELPVIRLFVHGLQLGATDILLFGMIHAKVVSINSDISQLQCGKLLSEWLTRVHKLTAHVASGADFQNIIDKVRTWNFEPSESQEVMLDKEEVPEKGVVDKTELENQVDGLAEHYQYTEVTAADVQWDMLDTLLKPQRNSTNNTNKMSQLQSMLSGVRFCVDHLRTQSSRIRIVDFCSGAGHLGIFLAHHFPDCDVILVETKWGSLRYAKDRIEKLGLSNVTLCLSHMGQFCGSFELGVSLHACGSATDYVIQQCTRNNAAIVSSPCCYGKIVNSSKIKYPRSDLVTKRLQNFSNFMEIARLADHEKDNEKFMKCVDVDRLEGLREFGYTYRSIQKLKPLTCSPKNNLIVALKN